MGLALSLAVQYIIKPPSIPSRYDFRRWVRASLNAEWQSVEITLRIVDLTEAQYLNKTYRYKDYATNVLTFCFDEDEILMPSSDKILRGDIVLCASVVEEEAKQQNKKLFAHYAHLVIHGVLHLQGYDHVLEPDAAIMEALEIAILERQGFANPYHSL